MDTTTYIDPFDYFSRRRFKDIEGRIVNVCRKIDNNIEVLTDPFLIIAKIDNKILAVRLRDQIKTKSIIWNSDQKWTIAANYIIEAKTKENLFMNKLPSSEIVISLETIEEMRDFNIDLNRIYTLRHLKERDVPGDIHVYADRRIFNDVIGVYASYSPTSEIAEYYNFTNWEEGN